PLAHPGRFEAKERSSFLWRPLAASHVAPRITLPRPDPLRLLMGHVVEDHEEEPVFDSHRLLLITQRHAHRRGTRSSAPPPYERHPILGHQDAPSASVTAERRLPALRVAVARGRFGVSRSSVAAYPMRHDRLVAADYNANEASRLVAQDSAGCFLRCRETRPHPKQ